MTDIAMPVIAVISGIGGLIAGYLVGQRHGCIAGELQALRHSLAERRSRHSHRHRHRHRDPEDSEQDAVE